MRIYRPGIALAFILLANTVIAQKPSELRQQAEQQKINQEVFGSDDPDFKVKDIPEKWQKESAVILCQKMDYSYLRDNSTLDVKEVIRRRVKLLDKASVEDFSEFFFRKTSEIGITIIKPDGKEIKVDSKEAVEVDDNVSVPLFYRTYYTYNLKYYKLAIPNLQVGDIIDYYYYSDDNASAALPQYSFSEFLFTMGSVYPILKQKMGFTIDRGFFINFRSFNGAPELKEGAAGVDSRGRVRANIKTYFLEDANREKIKAELWSYPYITYPTIKFQVVYVSPRTVATSNYFLGEVGELKSKISPEEVYKVLQREIKSLQTTNAITINSLNAYLKAEHNAVTHPQKIAQASYYWLRHNTLNQYYNGYSYYAREKRDFITANGFFFAAVLTSVFDRRNINSEVVVAIPRSLGGIKNILLSDEMMISMRVGGEKGFYLFPFNNFSTLNMMEANTESTDAYAFTMTTSPTDIRYKEVKLPSSSAADNNSKSTLNVSIDDALNLVTIERTCAVQGNLKEDYSIKALHGYDYIKKDDEYLNGAKPVVVPKGNKAKIEEEKRKEEAAQKEKEEERKKYFKEEAKEDFGDVTEYLEFELLEDGRYEDKAVLKFKDKFQVDNLINTAGKNYIFNIGGLIGEQLELKEEDMERKNDVYMRTARSYSNEITITIPAGYTVEGVNDLNMNVDNASGSFIVKATQEGNKITVTTEKRYKSNYVPKDKWSEMIAYLDAAYNFTQKKVILKRA